MPRLLLPQSGIAMKKKKIVNKTTLKNNWAAKVGLFLI